MINSLILKIPLYYEYEPEGFRKNKLILLKGYKWE